MLAPERVTVPVVDLTRSTEPASTAEMEPLETLKPAVLVSLPEPVIAPLWRATALEVPLYEPRLKAEHEERVKSGEGHDFWGRHEILESYNGVIKKLADEYHLDYVDVYTPERNSPEWPQMFQGDGIHMSEVGDRAIAMEILRFLARDRRG
jgi:lysophospholipase L1-like esterase